jgi:hypothetical protein
LPSKTPKPLSPGECALANHLSYEKIPFEREVCLIEGRKFRWDFWIAGKVAVEVQGGTWIRGGHSRGAGQAKDFEKANLLTLRGTPCLYYTTEQVIAGTAINDVLSLLKRG